MSLLLDLPDVLIKTIVCEWLEPPGFVHLDTALCNAGLREKFLKFIQDNRGNKDSPLLLCNVSAVHFRFPAFDSGRYGEGNPILDILRYAEKRSVGLSYVKVSQWPYFGIDSIWQTFLDGVSSLKIEGPETDDAPVTSALLQTYAGFRNVQEVSIIARYSFYVPLSQWCVQLRAMWPQLTKLAIDGGGSAHLSLHTEREDRWMGDTSHNSTSSIPASLLESLDAVCSRLIELRLLDIVLYPVDVFTLFGDIPMPHLESLELRSTVAEFITTAHYTNIELSSPRHHSTASPRNILTSRAVIVEPETIVDVHDISFATDTMRPTIGENTRLLHRPRHRITTQITSLDELCGYFAQSRRGALPHLRKLAGDAPWAYALLPLTTAASLRTLELNIDGENVGAIWCADSAFGMRIPSLRNVATLVVRVGDDFPVERCSFPMGALLANMPFLESIEYDRKISFHRVAALPDDSFAAAFRNLTQPLSRLRSLNLAGYIAPTAMEIHAFFEQLSRIAPQLRELYCFDLDVKLPCLFYSLRNSVTLQSLELHCIRVDYTQAPASWEELDLSRTDFMHLCQLTNLFRVRISGCGVYVRDAMLIRVFEALAHLAEFSLQQSPPAQEYAGCEENEENDYVGDEDDDDEDEGAGEEDEDEGAGEEDEDEGAGEEDEDERAGEEEQTARSASSRSVTRISTASTASTASKTEIITRNSVLLRDPLPPLNSEAYEEHVLHATYFLLHPKINEVRADRVDKLQVLSAARKCSGIALSYVTTASLDACVQLCPKLRKLVLTVPCLDLTAEKVREYLHSLPPCRLGSQPSYARQVRSSRFHLVVLRYGTARSFPRAAADERVLLGRAEMLREVEGPEMSII